jgi:hypothetical protein
MEIHLEFKITLASGEIVTQDIQLPADPNYPIDKQMKALMQTMINQYSTVGMLREVEPGVYRLLCHSQIYWVECSLPKIVLANATEVPQVTLE